MKQVITIVLILSAGPQLYGQETNDNQNRLLLVKEFTRRVFDMQPFDSIVKLTTLNKNLPKAQFKYKAAYFTVAMLQCKIHGRKYPPYSELSYIPYLALSKPQRTLIYDKSSIDGSQSGRDLSSIYAVYHKTELVTYVEVKNNKVEGMQAGINQGGTDYMHLFNMSYIDTDKSKVDSNSERLIKSRVTISKEDGLSVAKEFINFIYDSLNDRSTVKRYYRFQDRLYLEMIDDYTVSFLMDFLKQEIEKIPREEISVVPFSKLPRKQRVGLDARSENADEIFAVMHKGEAVTYLCLYGNKIKYFWAFKNLKGKYVFIPYGYANP